MTYRIEVASAARRALRGVPRPLLLKIDAAILGLAQDPRPSGCHKLSGREAWRIRVGDYRIIYEIHDGMLLVMVVDLGHRREIYR